MFVKNYGSFIEAFNIISNFEKASNSKINLKKTKLYGLGEWKDRVNYPINGMKVEIDHFSTLGITFSSDYDLALNFSWKKVSENIKTRMCIMSSRYLNIFQRQLLLML